MKFQFSCSYLAYRNTGIHTTNTQNKRDFTQTFINCQNTQHLCTKNWRNTRKVVWKFKTPTNLKKERVFLCHVHIMMSLGAICSLDEYLNPLGSLYFDLNVKGVSFGQCFRSSHLKLGKHCFSYCSSFMDDEKFGIQFCAGFLFMLQLHTRIN